MQFDTETPTPTPTLTPTITPTPTLTPTPTPQYFYEATTEADSLPVRFERTVTMGDYAVILLLVAVLLSMWVMFLLIRLRPKGGK